MRIIKHSLMALASVLFIACEQEDYTLGHSSSSSQSTNITLTALPPSDEEVIPLSLTTFSTEPFPQGPTDSDTLIHVTTIPAPCTLWQGHIVALVEPIVSTPKGNAPTRATVLARASVSSSRVPAASPSDSPATVPEASPSASPATVLARASVSSSLVPAASPSASPATVPEASPSASPATVPEAFASGPYEEFRILLLSKAEWTDLPSALNTTNPTAALNIPTTYT